MFKGLNLGLKENNNELTKLQIQWGPCLQQTCYVEHIALGYFLNVQILQQIMFKTLHVTMWSHINQMFGCMTNFR